MLSTMQEGELSVARLLRYGSTVHGDRTVRTWGGSEFRAATYAAVGRRAARLAHALRALGVSGDERVGTFMWNNNEHLEAYLAVPAMGAVLHTLNIRLTPDQLAYIADHAADQVIIVDGPLVPQFSRVLPLLRTLRHVVVANGDAATLEAPPGVEVHSYDDLLSAQAQEFAWPVVDERCAAAMCYTSGTTGAPKGVAYSHRSIWLHSMALCMTDGVRLAPEDSALTVVPMFHAMAWGIPYAAMMVGAALVMPDRFTQPESIAAMLAVEKPTFAAAVPTIWQGLLRRLETAPQDIAHLREVVVGGAACPPSLMRIFAERYGVQLLHTWGMTEMSPLGSVARPPASAIGDAAMAYRLTQGRFPASVQARLIDPAGAEVPWDGESVGEPEVSGPWTTASYHTPEGPVAEPDGFRDGWLRTGDVGRISADGFLTLTDRSKDVIKSGGEWISSVELENALMGHPAVTEAAVIAVPDEKWQERPLAAVVVREGEEVTAGQLRDFLADRVAGWQVPENWSFVDEIPKTSVGKFDKKRLRARFHENALDVLRLD